MWRLCGWCALAVGLLLEAGCAADGNKEAWDAFCKDLRGDNMQMQMDPSAGLDRSLGQKD